MLQFETNKLPNIFQVFLKFLRTQKYCYASIPDTFSVLFVTYVSIIITKLCKTKLTIKWRPTGENIAFILKSNRSFLFLAINNIGYFRYSWVMFTKIHENVDQNLFGMWDNRDLGKKSLFNRFFWLFVTVLCIWFDFLRSLDFL